VNVIEGCEASQWIDDGKVSCKFKSVFGPYENSQSPNIGFPQVHELPKRAQRIHHHIQQAIVSRASLRNGDEILVIAMSPDESSKQIKLLSDMQNGQPTGKGKSQVFIV
jgi:hypothetical protein